jgi:hypothetical protein
VPLNTALKAVEINSITIFINLAYIEPFHIDCDRFNTIEEVIILIKEKLGIADHRMFILIFGGR